MIHPAFTYFKIGFSWLLLLNLGLKAGPIQWGQVPDDAKWVAHIDLEGLRQTKLYQQIHNLFLKEPMAELEAKMETEIGMKIPIDGLVSITAYGKTLSKEPDQDGVLLLELTPELKKIASTWLAGNESESQAKRPDINQPVDTDITGVFNVANELTIASDTDSNYLCLGPNQERIVAKVKQLGTKRMDGPAKENFSNHPVPKGAVAYLAVANILEEATLPAHQAKVLQLSKGASLSLGESQDNVFINLHLRTQDSQASMQIQRILAGIQAVAMINAQQPEWFPLIQAIDIRNDNQRVQVNWNLSLQNANKLIHALQGTGK
jgi:hypothetical protein